ncbi:MAG: TIM barrel protein [Clostridiales bacterium]|nr:TIM barrel protein [Eubacteriales bacterium]MDH7566232.1 TIM barrel protein [Clostridiales bacterium]
MLKLLNLATYSGYLKNFNNNPVELEAFLKRHRLDGLELIQYDPWKPSLVPPRLIGGLHMRFWPTWLDFWRMDLPQLERQFGKISTCRQYYGGERPEALVEYYREELKTALQMGVKYVVFHVSHVRPAESYTYRFPCSHGEVVEAFLELLNGALEGFEADFDMLFENQWWPGLTLLDREVPLRLLEGVRYPRKGFVLDISHMMNTNTELSTEEEASQYILDRLDELGEVAAYIKGVHLNSCLSGQYVKDAVRIANNGSGCRDRVTIWDEELYHHISKIDRHTPFTHSSIRRVMDRVRPEYLVYELLAPSLDVLEGYIEEQDRALGWGDQAPL